VNESTREDSAPRETPVLGMSVACGLAAISLAFAYREALALVAEPEAPLASQTLIRTDTAPDLALVLFLVMLAFRRADIRRAVALPGRVWHACTLLVPSTVILLWAHVQGAPDLLFLSLSLAVLGSSWLLGGALLCRTLLPAAGILLFAMPIPAALRNPFVFALQNASAKLTSGLLEVLNVTHARVGDILELGGESFQVVEECSGIASIGALSLAAVFYLGLFRCTSLQAALLIAVAPAIGLLANSFRVLWLTLGDPSGARDEHSLQGLAVIALGALALGAFDRLLGRLPAVKARASRPRLRRRRLEGLPRRRVFVLCALFIAVGASLEALPPRVAGTSRPRERRRRDQSRILGLDGLRRGSAQALPQGPTKRDTIRRRRRPGRSPGEWEIPEDRRPGRELARRRSPTPRPRVRRSEGGGAGDGKRVESGARLSLVVRIRLPGVRGAPLPDRPRAAPHGAAARTRGAAEHPATEWRECPRRSRCPAQVIHRDPGASDVMARSWGRFGLVAEFPPVHFISGRD